MSRNNSKSLTIVRWVNSVLARGKYDPIESMTDSSMRTGIKLMQLMAVLSGEPLPRHNQRCLLRAQKLDNVDQALKMVKRAGVPNSLVHTEHIVDGNEKMVFGLLWAIFKRFSLSKISLRRKNGGDALRGKEGLLAWVNDNLANESGSAEGKADGKDDGNDSSSKSSNPVTVVSNFTSDWSDGSVLCSILRHNGSEKTGMSRVATMSAEEKIKTGLTVAEKEFDVPRLLDVSDFKKPIDERNILVYVSELYIQINAQKADQAQKSFEKMRNEANTQIGDLEAQIKSLKEKVSISNKELEDKNAKLKDLASANEELQRRLETVEGGLKNCQEEKQQHEKEYKSCLGKSEEELKDCEKEKSDLRMKLSQLQESSDARVLELERANEELRRLLEGVKEDLKDCREKKETQNTTLEARVRAFEGENDKLKSELLTCEKNLKQLQTTRDAQAQELNHENANLRTQLEGVTKELKDYKEKQKEDDSSLRGTEKALRDCEKEKQQLHTKLQLANGEIKDLAQTLSALRKENHDMKIASAANHGKGLVGQGGSENSGLLKQLQKENREKDIKIKELYEKILHLSSSLKKSLHAQITAQSKLQVPRSSRSRTRGDSRNSRTKSGSRSRSRSRASSRASARSASRSSFGRRDDEKEKEIQRKMVAEKMEEFMAKDPHGHLLSKIENNAFLFGTRKIHLFIVTGELHVRVGGGYVSLAEYCAKYGHVERLHLEKQKEKIEALLKLAGKEETTEAPTSSTTTPWRS